MTSSTLFRRGLFAATLALSIPAALAFASDRAVGTATPAMSASQAITAVEAAGYRTVAKLEWEHGVWQVRALDAEGRRVTLRVDERSGEVRRDERRSGRAG